ncbi:MAG: amidohydrolase family protein [Fimbriimonadaceae bacterium]|nr:amidohydrolase family protein [Fimbriimonadaceae bacterium]
MTLRPYGVVQRGRLELGLELEVIDGTIVSLGPQTGMPDPYVLSPAFVNAHSHLEYRGMLGRIDDPEYVGWIRTVTRMKTEQSPEEVEADCLLAAEENVASGVAYVAEHSDRPGAAAAMRSCGLDGVVFQEVITFLEQNGPEARLARAEERRVAASHSVDKAYLNPHAPHTVDGATLGLLAGLGTPLSVHVAETVHERSFWESDDGPLAEVYRAHAVPRPWRGRLLDYLAAQGVMRPGVQLVHFCDADAQDLGQAAEAGVVVAHCPRSNERLQCPRAPVREMLDAGILVGLGLDSAASSGPVDMFAEMRAALEVSLRRSRLVTAEEVWDMATTMGARSLGQDDWEIKPGAKVPLVALDLAGCLTTDEMVGRGGPESVLWQTASGSKTSG